MFMRLSRVIAILVLIIGIAEFAMGWAIAIGVIGPYEQALARYTTETSSGALISRAIHLIAFALVLGTLSEIAGSLRKNKAEV